MTRITKGRGARIAGIAVTAGALTIVGSSAAWAHECFNASRSATGNTAAGTHSQAWYQVQIADAIAEDVANGYYSADQGACAYDYWLSHGGPASVTFHVKGANGSDGVIGEKNPNGALRGDGRGIDHFEEAYGALVAEAFTACGIAM